MALTARATRPHFAKTLWLALNAQAVCFWENCVKVDKVMRNRSDLRSFGQDKSNFVWQASGNQHHSVDMPMTLDQRLSGLLQFIETNLDKPLGVRQLAEQVHCSEYHFQRWFQSQCQMPVASYIRLLRLQRAATALAYRETPVTLLAQEAGYQNAESFSRAFRRWLAQSPSEFRQQPDWLYWASKSEQTMPLVPQYPQVEVVDFPTTRIALKVHKGPETLLGQSIREFINWRKANGLPPQRHATFNLLYEDPRCCEPADYRFGLAVAVDGEVAENDAQIVESEISGGPCARIRWQGSDAQIGPLVEYLYTVWLPQNGFSLRDQPIFLQRRRFFPDVPAHEAETDIFLPLI